MKRAFNLSRARTFLIQPIQVYTAGPKVQPHKSVSRGVPPHRPSIYTSVSGSPIPQGKKKKMKYKQNRTKQKQKTLLKRQKQKHTKINKIVNSSKDPFQRQSVGFFLFFFYIFTHSLQLI